MEGLSSRRAGFSGQTFDRLQVRSSHLLHELSQELLAEPKAVDLSRVDKGEAGLQQRLVGLQARGLVVPRGGQGWVVR
jgi:hypothetical protein